MPDPTPHEPTAESRRQVSTMVAFGIPQDKIAAILGTSPPTLRKYYREEIDIADAKAQSMVEKFLFSAATGEALRAGAAHLPQTRKLATGYPPCRLAIWPSSGGLPGPDLGAFGRQTRGSVVTLHLPRETGKAVS